jgi:thioesterase domain-containing protein
VTRIKTVLSHDVPLSALFETPTVREMAARLRTQSGASAWAPLVPIRKTGTRPPFFCVHPIGGNVLAFVDLVRHVDADIPFYALQSIGLDGAVEPYASVEQIAAHYLREIRAVQSEGPYYLGGFSFGGLVAFELARQLEQSGAIVGVVALLDMECPLVGGRLIFKESMAQHEATLLVQSSLTLRKHYAARPDDLREIEPLESQPLIARVLDHLRIPAQWRENARRVFTILLQSSRALRDYVPGPYGGTLTVFRSTDDAGAAEYAQLLQPGRERPEAMQAWQAFAAGGVDLVEVPGDHITMLTEPHVAVLGQRLTACLTRAERVHDGPVAGVAS